MAQNLAQKKGQFLARCVLNDQALLLAYNTWRQQRAEYASEGYSTITQTDIDAVASPPPVVNGVAVPVAHLSPSVLTNYMSTFDFIDSAINSNTGGLQGSVGFLTNIYNMEP